MALESGSFIVGVLCTLLLFVIIQFVRFLIKDYVDQRITARIDENVRMHKLR